MVWWFLQHRARRRHVALFLVLSALRRWRQIAIVFTADSANFTYNAVAAVAGLGSVRLLTCCCRCCCCCVESVGAAVARILCPEMVSVSCKPSAPIIHDPAWHWEPSGKACMLNEFVEKQAGCGWHLLWGCLLTLPVQQPR